MESLRKWSGEKSNATNFDMMGSDGTHELYMESCKRALHGMIWFAPHMKRFSAISSGFSCKTSILTAQSSPSLFQQSSIKCKKSDGLDAIYQQDQPNQCGPPSCRHQTPTSPTVCKGCSSREIREIS
ncbi:hypothetical protein OIU85_029605 [Salix viminalis]|uniref:Uncharacterized protein n=1 Tax=Salix viminalis TaxID=40686 RepID=A0A9Q0QC05_SALVM|nr:hypothetical protein OIU85_029605 [Salix viminalis]